MNEVRIADKIAAMIDDLNVWLPQDVFNVVRLYPSDFQMEVLDALKRKQHKVFRVLTTRGGDPARSGQETGYVIAVNQAIRVVHDSGPAGGETVDRVRTWRIGGNTISMAGYYKFWTPLD
jgi:hypothetical protein